MKRILLVAATTLLLGACASNGMRDGLVYRDGSWYSPGADGRGDYYTGVEHHHDMAYDWPWAWSVGFVPYGGYCPAMYRYCTAFWADPWYGWGLYYPYPLAWQPGHRHRHHADEAPPVAESEPVERMRRDPAERRAPRERSGGPAPGPRQDGGEPRPRRRTTGARPSPN